MFLKAVKNCLVVIFSLIPVYVSAMSVVVINDSPVTLTYDDAVGIEVKAHYYSTVTNNSSISVAGDRVRGISLDELDVSTVTNNGDIVASGDNAEGLYIDYSPEITINNSGGIMASGDSAHGLYLEYSRDSTINNTGNIIVTGDGAVGIYSEDSSGVTVNNTGLISATGDNSFAIYHDSNTDNSTLNLYFGSQIIGDIFLGGSDDVVNIYALSSSANLSFTGAETINLMDGVVGVVSGNSVVTIDPTSTALQSQSHAAVVSSIHSVAFTQANSEMVKEDVQLAGLTLAPGMLYQPSKPIAWGQMFIGRASHSAQNNALAYNSGHLGFAVGYEWDIEQTRFGVLGGVVRTRSETQITSFAADANSFYLGTYARFTLPGVKLTGSLIGGLSRSSNERTVYDNSNGVEVASANVNGLFISPSLKLSSRFVLSDQWQLRPAASVSYNLTQLAGYSESGTTSSNLDIEKRTLKSRSASLEVAAIYKPDLQSELQLTLGASHTQRDDQDTYASLSGNEFSFASAGADQTTGLYGSVNYRADVRDDLSFTSNVEIGGGSSTHYMAGVFSLEYRF